MITTISVPNGTTQVSYGKIILQPDENSQLEVPDYVAFTLLKQAGVALVSGAAAGSALALLTAIDQDWEANYIFQAYGQSLPAAPRLAAGITLLNARGEPASSLS
jgi:hypothetical protein